MNTRDGRCRQLQEFLVVLLAKDGEDPLLQGMIGETDLTMGSKAK